MNQILDRPPIELVDVTLRDGEQMKINDVSEQDRIEVVDVVVRTGIRTLEVGHGGNEVDSQFIATTLKHIEKMATEDPRYKGLAIQVLFGSQEDIIEQGLKVFEGFNKDKVTLHIYDRLSPHLRSLAEEPYTAEQSADRIKRACAIALDAGFTSFSISGEGATDASVDEAVEFYTDIAEYLISNGATAVNTNLANTPGSAPEEEWDIEGLTYFHQQIKSIPNTTTSVHPHDDGVSANEFSVTAIKAGFDKVEGTLIGMGEKTGNVALCDTLVRLLEIARLELERTQRPESAWRLGRAALFQTRSLPQTIAGNLKNWHGSCNRVAEIYGTQQRWHATSLGHPESYNAGSGPHDHASKRALENPLKWPLWRNYLRISLIHAMLGRPEAEGIIAADPEVIRAITVNGHSAGGSTKKIIEGNAPEASQEVRRAAIREAQSAIKKIYDHAAA